jgi:hypothetical protein
MGNSKFIDTVISRCLKPLHCINFTNLILEIINLEDLKLLCGKFKGIQGHHNSCYLDGLYLLLSLKFPF